jgi:GNAT superfamily N-acetyltransferase
MEYEIRLANEENLDEVFELWRKLMGEHRILDSDFFSEINEERYKEDLMKCLSYPDEASLFVCIKKRKVIGYVTAAITQRYKYYNANNYCIIDDIMVDSSFRGEGIGKALIKSVENWAKQYNTKRIELNVIHRNTKGYNFFKNCGFQDSWHSLVLTL